MISFFFFAQNCLNFHFNQKKTIILLKRVQSETIFQTKRKSPIFAKMLFTETNETSRVHPRSLIFCFCCKFIAAAISHLAFAKSMESHSQDIWFLNRSSNLIKELSNQKRPLNLNIFDKIF